LHNYSLGIEPAIAGVTRLDRKRKVEGAWRKVARKVATQVR
jgi:hypothetical protein